MEAIEFILNYTHYLDEIKQITAPELKPVADRLRQIDPPHLVRSEEWFPGESCTRGY